MSPIFWIAFALLACLAVFAAAKMIFSHHPIHSALYLVLNLCASAGIYLLLGAPFIAIVQVAVYAGAIMVLFLFIIMYLNLGLARDVADHRGRRLLGYCAATLIALLIVAGGAVRWRGETSVTTAAVQSLGPATAPAAAAVPAGWQGSTVEDIGVMLFSRYALPFEIASLLILVAMIGALVIARPQLMREAAVREEARG